jgi:flavin-dependent dehydrogenase
MIDVAVVGGGPAGCAAALSLRKSFPALSVALFEARDYAEHRPGEILPPAARSLLNSLQVLHFLNERIARPSRAMTFRWGRTLLERNDYFFSARGGGWHLDRSRFDAMLADACVERGVEVLRGTAVHGSNRRNALWEIAAGSECLSARFVVDATGRAAAFARMHGECIQFDDALTSYSRVIADCGPCVTEPLVESVQSGWWYTAPLPEGRRVASFMTDADIGRKFGLPANRAWSELVKNTIHIAAAIGRGTVVSDCIVRPASSTHLSRACGDGWLAVGDAVAAYDPLAGQGITKALRNGMLASYAAGDALLGRERAAANRYSAILQAQLEHYRLTRSAHYAHETRWRDSIFWARRQATSRHWPAGEPPSEWSPMSFEQFEQISVTTEE